MSITKKFTGLCLAGALVLAGAAQGETLKMASTAPEGSVWYDQAMNFVNAVNESGADLTIELFPGAQLGSDADSLKSTLSGRIDLWVGVIPVLSSVTPELALMNLPYMFETDDELKCVAPKIREAWQALAGKKYHLLHMAPVGNQDVSATTPIRVPQDLAGVKIRTAPSLSALALFKAAGATPQPLSGSESASALNTGLVNAMDMSVVYLIVSGASKIADKITRTGHSKNLGATIVSPRTWAKLNDAQRSALEDAAAKVDLGTEWDQVLRVEEMLLQKAIAGGAEVITLTDEERAEWVKLGKSVWPDVMSQLRGAPEAFMARIDEARAVCQ